MGQINRVTGKIKVKREIMNKKGQQKKTDT